MTTPRDAIAGLEPCPFCGVNLYTRPRGFNPAGYCRTEGCFGKKMPVVNLDDPTIVAAWNSRAPAATQLDSLLKERDALQARVRQLEGDMEYQARAHSKLVNELEEDRVSAWNRCREAESQRDVAKAAADTLRQERDEAYERLKPFAKVGELFQPREPGDYDQCIYAPAAGSEYNLSGDHLRAARDLVRRLAGPEKEKPATNDGEERPSPPEGKI